MTTATLPRTETLKSEYALTLSELQEVRQERDRPEVELQSKLDAIELQLTQADAEAKRAALESYIPTAKAQLGSTARNLNAALQYFQNATQQLEQAVQEHDAIVADVSLSLAELEAASPDNGRVHVAGRPFPNIDSVSVRAAGTDVVTEISALIEGLYRRANLGIVADSLATVRRGGNRLQASPFADCYEGE